MARSRKLTFDDEIVKEEPKTEEEPVAEYPSVFSSPVETPVMEVEDPEPEHKPEPAPMPKEEVVITKEQAKEIKKGIEQTEEETIKMEIPPKMPEPVEKARTIEDLAYTGPEPAGTNPIAPKLHETKDILTASMHSRAQEYYDNAMREQFGGRAQQTGTLREEIAKILKPNPDEDMIKALVHFSGAQENWILIDVQPILLKQAWEFYCQHEMPVPGKFMELVFEILNVNSRRYAHRVSTVELK